MHSSVSCCLLLRHTIWESHFIWIGRHNYCFFFVFLFPLLQSMHLALVMILRGGLELRSLPDKLFFHRRAITFHLRQWLMIYDCTLCISAGFKTYCTFFCLSANHRLSHSSIFLSPPCLLPCLLQLSRTKEAVVWGLGHISVHDSVVSHRFSKCSWNT